MESPDLISFFNYKPFNSKAREKQLYTMPCSSKPQLPKGKKTDRKGMSTTQRHHTRSASLVAAEECQEETVIAEQQSFGADMIHTLLLCAVRTHMAYMWHMVKIEGGAICSTHMALPAQMIEAAVMPQSHFKFDSISKCYQMTRRR